MRAWSSARSTARQRPDVPSSSASGKDHPSSAYLRGGPHPAAPLAFRAGYSGPFRPEVMMANATVFIDGEAGTTGLGIRERLAAMPEVTVRSIDPERRKDADARLQMMAEADLVVLCLPDAAARESTELADSLGDRAPKLLDASTAHRVDPDWVYGFAELEIGQKNR